MDRADAFGWRARPGIGAPVGDFGKSGVRRFKRAELAGLKKFASTVDLNGSEVVIIATQVGKRRQNLGCTPMIGFGDNQSSEFLQFSGLVAPSAHATFADILGEVVGKGALGKADGGALHENDDGRGNGIGIAIGSCQGIDVGFERVAPMAFPERDLPGEERSQAARRSVGIRQHHQGAESIGKGIDGAAVCGRRPVFESALRLVVGPDDGDGGRQVTP